MSITVVGIGIGKDVDPQVMQKIAGDKGKVLMYEDFDELAALFNEMMEAAVCRKFVLSYFLFLNYKKTENDTLFFF